MLANISCKPKKRKSSKKSKHKRQSSPNGRELEVGGQDGLSSTSDDDERKLKKEKKTKKKKKKKKKRQSTLSYTRTSSKSESKSYVPSLVETSLPSKGSIHAL